jgi:restriction endonuclease S subunit
MQKIDLKNINKLDWESFRFEEIASKISETVDPNSTSLEIYVGLEHLDAEDIHIRRKGTPDDVSGGKLKCYPGDVIFGKRRAYQRKAAIVDFEGICSAHAFVFRANPEIIEPNLFPFFLHSDQFMHRMVDISVGGLSPTINWGDLKHQEFLLPPKDQQAKLAELLWAMDEVIEREREVLKELEKNLNSFIRQIFTSHIKKDISKEPIHCKSLFQTKQESRQLPAGWKPVRLSEVISNAQNGFAEGERDDFGIAQLRMNNVTRDGRINLEKIAMIPKRSNIGRYTISLDDVLFCNTNSEDLVGKSILATSEIENFCFSNHFTRLRANQKLVTQKFLYLWLKFHFEIGLFERICTRWIGQAAVQTESLMRLQIILPSIEEQIYAGVYCQQIENNIDLVQSKITTSKSLQKSLINQIF